MTQLAARAASTLDGEEQRGLQFFRLLQDDVLIFTEEFIGPDLRELRSFINGYLRRDFQSFRDTFERLRIDGDRSDPEGQDLPQRAAALRRHRRPGDHRRAAARQRASRPSSSKTHASRTPSRAKTASSSRSSRKPRARVRRAQSAAPRHRLDDHDRRTAQIVSTDRRNATTFSRSTRPLDFGRPASSIRWSIASA